MVLNCDKIQIIMANRNLNYVQLSELCGINYETLKSTLRKGNRKIMPSTITKISNGLNVSVEEITISDGEYRDLLVTRLLKRVNEKKELETLGLQDVADNLEKEIDSLRKEIVKVGGINGK